MIDTALIIVAILCFLAGALSNRIIYPRVNEVFCKGKRCAKNLTCQRYTRQEFAKFYSRIDDNCCQSNEFGAFVRDYSVDQRMEHTPPRSCDYPR